MADAEVDTAQLSSYCSIPQESLETLLDKPTKELICRLLQSITIKVREHNELASEKLKLEVELEKAVRGGESKTRALKSSAEKANKGAADLRAKLQSEETARTNVETELENLKTATSSSVSEINTLKARIESLESSKQDTVSLLESKSSAYDKLGEELNSQHQKTVELRKQVASLEHSVQSANTVSASARFHEQTLQEEIESLKRDNDWLDTELKTKSTEYTKYRKEKSLRIAELQRQYDEAQSVIEMANRTETTLRRRLEELSQKADDSFTRIQQMEEDAAKNDEASRTAVQTANRLTELTQNKAETERQRQQDLSAQLETLREEASEQQGRLLAEIETEHEKNAVLEAEIAKSEAQNEQLHADIMALQAQATTHGAANTAVNGISPRTPSRGGASTPMGSPATPRTKGGLNVTQMYSNYNDLKSELAIERSRNQTLSSTLDGLLQDMERKEPEIQEQRNELERLKADLAEISSLLAVTGEERNQAVKDANKWQGQTHAKIKEGEVLRQQLRDLSTQVKVLLMELNFQDQGHRDLDAGERAKLQRIAQGQLDDEDAEGMTDTDRLIGEQLVAFRNITELQAQNVQLLNITRTLGEKMEQEEAQRQQTEATRNWDELQDKYQHCKEEIKILVTQSQSYVRERDMFRRMLTHRGQLPAGSESESINGDPASISGHTGVIDSSEGSPSAGHTADQAKVLKEMQAHCDAIRNEAATDHKKMKEQLDELARRNNQLLSEAARNSSQVTLAHERYDMLQANHGMLKNENSELQKRLQSLSESGSKQEMRVQQVAEDLYETKGLLESTRNENANLKAEKEFWKKIEKRITEDSQNLLNERSKLNALNVNLQTLLNEREHSDSETRRRLQSQIEHLEQDLQATKAKLSEEVEENKRSTQRREYDSEQSQKRLDDLIASLGSLREQLAVANITKDHLSGKVEELTIQLRSAEERVSVLQPTPASRPQAAADGEDSGLDKEQELAVQVSELKRDLGLTKAELESAKGQVEQYKAISNASEEELRSLNETQELYKQETDKLIEDRNAKIKKLQQQIDDTTSELASTNAELAHLRTEQLENSRRLDDQRKAHEAELVQLKDESERHAEKASLLQEDLREQANIAQRAQQDYDNELIKHSDAAKALQKLRGDYNQVRLEIAEAKSEAESARTSLSQNEESWAESKDRYERELADLRTGRESLTAQNNRLHQQLESVTAQISDLKKQAQSDSSSSNQENAGSSLETQQEIIGYLRREKEIVDVQLQMSEHREKGLQQQLNYTKLQLDDVQMRLSQQRRLEADSERKNLDHARLKETIDELNTFRESSVTLRAESRQAQRALSAKIKELEELTAQFEPLRTEILELQNKNETQEGEMKLLKENSNYWEQRTQTILHKYDRIDPAEMDTLKEKITALESERDEALSSCQRLQEQLDSASIQITQAQEQSNEKLEAMRARLTDQFKSRSKTLSDRIKEKDSALQTAVTEKQDLEQGLTELSNLRKELETAKAERDAAIERVITQKVDTGAPDSSEEGQVDEAEAVKPSQADPSELQSKLAAAETEIEQQASESAGLHTQLEASRSRIAELEAIINQLQARVDASETEVARSHSAAQQANISSNGEAEQQLLQLREDLARVQQDAEKLRTAASVNASIANAPEEDGSKSVAEQVAEHVDAVRAELEARHTARVKEIDEILEKRTNAMKNNLTKKLTEGKNQIRQSLTTEHEQAIAVLKKGHEEDLERLKIRHKDELDELRKVVDEAKQKPEAAETTDGAPNVKGEDQMSRDGPWQPSDGEIRALVSSNETVKGILRQNVLKQVTKAKEEVSTQLKEQYEKSLAEVQNKSNSTKDHAVLMEGKKNALQINMAANKAKIAQFKLDLVQKAAQDTPDKAVAEVWSAVKDTRPPASAPQLQQNVLPAQISPRVNPFGQPGPLLASQPKPAQASGPSFPTGSTTFGRPSSPVLPAQPRSPTTQQRPQSPSQQQQSSPQHPPAAGANNQQRPPQPTPSQSQDKQQKMPQGVGNHPNSGTGPAALRGLQQSGLPVARGGSTRGTVNARGRGGSGIPRGGQVNTNHSQGQQQGGRGSPLSAGAKQFIPGNKRPREETSDGHQADGVGKRIRGGGTAS